MNLIRQYKIVFLACIALALQGCKKLIEIDPPVSVVGTGQVFNNNTQANAAMAGVYSQMMTNTGAMIFSNGGLTVYAGMSADELVNLQGTNNVTDYQFLTNKLDVLNTTAQSTIWQPAYKIIYGANAVIEGVEGSTSLQLTDSVRKVLTGEALFVRAFCYFYLTNLYGDVPLVLATDFRKSASMTRTAQETVYNQIVKDLQAAQLLLPTDYSTAGGERVRPNKWAATAMLARTQLYLKKWEDAAAQASDVISQTRYSLPALASVFQRNSAESIWQLKQNPARQPYNVTWDGANLLPIIRWNQLSEEEQFVFSLPEYFNEAVGFVIPMFYFTRQQVQAFEAKDRRRTTWADSTPTPADAPYHGVPFFYSTKYNQQQGTAGAAVTQYFTVLRLAEQRLIRAEARAHLDDLTGAAADINALRSRAGLLNTTAVTKEELLTAVAHERQTELFAEWGHRWLDLKRTGQAGAVLGAIPAKQPWKSSQLLYPIAQGEITSNPNIIQNPDY